MDTKLSKVKSALASGDEIAALRIVAKFPRLGVQKDAITRAWAAYQNPEFYREIGKNPAELVAFGVAAVREKYGI